MPHLYWVRHIFDTKSPIQHHLFSTLYAVGRVFKRIIPFDTGV